ncbi:MAG: hypothetical protein AAGH76_12005 [Pseudomonadota bacterium]
MALRRCRAVAHIVEDSGQWIVAERSISGHAARDWLSGGTAIASILAAERGAYSVDLSLASCDDIDRFLGLGCARVTSRERVVLQVTFEQAAALCEERSISAWPCHVIVQRAELPQLPRERRRWPTRWIPVFPRWLRSTTPVLGDEPFATVSPTLRLCLPSNAVTLPVSVSLLPYWSRRGLAGDELSSALAQIIDAADALIDEVRWPLAADVWDTYRHRRLALLPRDLGELVQLAGLGNHTERAVAFLTRVLRQFNDSAQDHSAALARRDGGYAALAPEQALGHLIGRADYDVWCERWRIATRGYVYRHRNLTMACLSDLWAGQSSNRRPAAWCQALNVVDGVGFGERWPAIVTKMGDTPAFGHLAATLTRPSGT